MDVERMHPSGGIKVSDIINNELVTLRFFGYTEAQAKALFKQQTKKRR